MSDSMWHEARRQERRIRGMLVDYRRRAERRRDFYERIKADPTQFLQVHGRQCKIHLDPSVAAAADSSTAMMPWQGDPDNLIDRFDVRAHLDFIPVVKKDEEEELSQEERQLNYERYRIIAQNSFLGLSEEKFLKQLHIEEQFGYTDNKEKRKERAAGVAIGFNYEDGTGTSQPQPVTETNEAESEHSDSDLDVDLSINVSKMDPSEAHEMNRHGRNYGMSSNDFYSFLIKDLDEAESYRLAKEEEHEKALYAGRKSRRERRAHREKRLANRVISPPSYAARKSPDYAAFRQSKSPSKSPTPDNAGKITYITSFGDDEEPASKPTYADKVKMGKSRKGDNSSCERSIYMAKSSDSFKRKRSPSRSSRSTSRQRRSKSRDRYRKRSRSRSKSKSRSSSTSRRSSSRKRVYRGMKSRSSSSSSSESPKKRSRSSSSSTSSSSDREPKKPRSKSKSPSVKKESPPKQIPRYYGRRKSDLSSSELSDSDVNEKDEKEMINSNNKPGYGNTGSSFKKSTGTSMSSLALSFQERLRRKRQALLNKQFKADKIAEMTKAEREKQEQQTREDELREMGIKLRKRQREKRHAYDSDSSLSTHSSTVRSRSPKKDAEETKSRSPSPQLRNEEQEHKKRSTRTEDSKDTPYSRRKSPVKYEEKRTVYLEERDRYDRDRRTDRDRRDDRDRRYNRDRREDRGRWDDKDRDRRNDRSDRDKRDVRNRRDDRDRRDWRNRDSSRRDRYENNSDNDTNSKPLRSLVDY